MFSPYNCPDLALPECFAHVQLMIAGTAWGRDHMSYPSPWQRLPFLCDRWPLDVRSLKHSTSIASFDVRFQLDIISHISRANSHFATAELKT
jgi:hypothetical protein